MRRLRLSQRATQTPPSPIRRLAPEAIKAESRGLKVYRINIGQPDVPTPPEYYEGLTNFNESALRYDPSEGSQALRLAWADYLKRTIGLSVGPELITITMGASEALIFAFMTCCDPGDEVIVFDPTYANYMGFGALAGVKLIPLFCSPDNGYALPRIEEIEASFSNRTRAILLCNPNNPTGTFYERRQIAELLELCAENNIFLIVDETYRELVFDGVSPFSAFQVASKSERLIVIDSLSKRFSLCGARLGCLITANQDVNQAIFNIAQARLAAPTLEQFAAAYMLTKLGPAHLDSVVKMYQERRDAFIGSLSGIEGIEFAVPKGAFYLVAQLPIPNAEDFCRFMLSSFNFENETVFLAPGQGFFINSQKGSNTIRMAFVLESKHLVRAAQVFSCGLEEYRKTI